MTGADTPEGMVRVLAEAKEAKRVCSVVTARERGRWYSEQGDNACSAGKGLEAGRRMTLVSAPAGFRKTVCVSAWSDELDRPVAWLNLDAAGDDPGLFSCSTPFTPTSRRSMSMETYP